MLFVNSNTKRFGERLFNQQPDAVARIKGSPFYPSVKGTASFYRTIRGVLVVAEVYGLPQGNGKCAVQVFGFHIHEGKSCTGNASNPFADALGHYNPNNCPHPQHAGDLPPLFGNNGYAFNAVLTDRFSIAEVMGRAVIIHRNPDDFTTQPSGNSGEMIACGLIEPQ